MRNEHCQSARFVGKELSRPLNLFAVIGMTLSHVLLVAFILASPLVNAREIATNPGHPKLQGLPYGDHYSLAPMIQDDEFYYYATENDPATTHVFDGGWKTIGTNTYGSSGGEFRLTDRTEELQDGSLKISVQVTAVNSQRAPEPWVNEQHSGAGFLGWRLDIGSGAGGSDQINVEAPFEIVESGVRLYDSNNESIAQLEINDTSDSDGLSGTISIGLSDGAEVAGYDMATMVVYWIIRVDSSQSAANTTLSFNGVLAVEDENLRSLIGNEMPVYGQFTVNENAESVHTQEMDGGDCIVSVYPFEEIILNVANTQYVIDRSEVSNFEPGFGLHIQNCEDDSPSPDVISIHLFLFLPIIEPLEPIRIGDVDASLELVFIDAFGESSAFSGLNASSAKEFSSQLMQFKSIAIDVNVNGTSYQLNDWSSIFSSSETSNLADGYVVSVDGVDPNELADLLGAHETSNSHYLFDAIGQEWNNFYTKNIGPVIHFDWTRNPRDTEETVVNLVEMLEKLSKLSREKGSELVVLAHSWGTVLTYIAANVGDEIDIARFYTLGSPLGAQWFPYWKHSDLYLSDFGLSTDIKKRPSNIGAWTNYWNKCDNISGPIQRYVVKSNKQRGNRYPKGSIKRLWVDSSGIENHQMFADSSALEFFECHNDYFENYVNWTSILTDIKSPASQESLLRK